MAADICNFTDNGDKNSQAVLAALWVRILRESFSNGFSGCSRAFFFVVSIASDRVLLKKSGRLMPLERYSCDRDNLKGNWLRRTLPVSKFIAIYDDCCSRARRGSTEPTSERRTPESILKTHWQKKVPIYTFFFNVIKSRFSPRCFSCRVGLLSLSPV